MTAEIGVMNNLGVALAADSAVTLGAGQGKIYTSADKLFHLSSAAPVGAMIYGSGGFVGIPWETLIKTYRRQLGCKTFDKLEKYALSLMSFLRQRNDMFSCSFQIRESEALVNVAFGMVRDEIWKQLKEKEKSGTKISNDEIRKTISEVIRKNVARGRKYAPPRGLPKNIRQVLRKKLGTRFTSMKRDIFKKLPIAATASRGLTTIALDALTRCVGLYESGIVVAGFGEKEFTPGLVEIGIYGMIEGSPKYHIKKEYIIDDQTRSCLVPFAQKEMVYAFMEGIDREINKMMRKSTRSLFSGVTKAIVDKIKKHNTKFGNNLEKEVNPAVDTLLKNLFKRWSSKSKESHWGPITSILSSLPKDELGAMAEALVNLTKFRRRVSAEKETVAGPIDVAVITKGDGFIWVKRKHYFDPQLNPRTMARYLKEVFYNDKE